jgi:hypothetical protein
MRGLFGIVGLLITLAIVGVLVKKQSAPLVTGGAAPAQSGQQQSEQIQAQVKQSIDAALQTPRAVPDDK